jgi:hypothetical protein
MTHALLEQRIRRRESIKALKNRNRTLPPLPEAVPFVDALPAGTQGETPAPNPLDAFKAALNQIEVQKQQYLAKPKPKGGGLLKFSNFIVILLFLLGAGLFFIGGYIYSYIHPLPGTSVTTVPTSASSEPQWGITAARAPTLASNQSVPEGYVERKQYLQDQQAYIDALVASGMSRSEAVLRSEANRFATNAGSGLIAWVKKVAGEGLGNIFAPFADTIIKGTVGTAVGKNAPVTATNNNSQATNQAPSQDSRPAATATPDPSTSKAPNAAAASSQSNSSGATGEAAETGHTLFALELRTFPDRTDAFMFMRDLKAQGYNTVYTVKSLHDGNIVFTVRVGNFSTYMEAAKGRKSLAIPSRVVIVPQHDELIHY